MEPFSSLSYLKENPRKQQAQTDSFALLRQKGVQPGRLVIPDHKSATN